MRLHLVDDNDALVEAWRRELAPFPEVSVAAADILVVAHGALVSPANSQGHMDGGIDLSYLQCFGMRLQLAVYEAIARRPEGFLPIGSAEVVRTGHARIPYLIVAPTMEFPGQVPAEHSYRAMGAVLRAAQRHQALFDDVYCPGLATGVGGVAPDDAAHAMAEAYRGWKSRSEAASTYH